MIGDIELVAAKIRGDSIRLGIKAPKVVPVHRKEVWLQVQEQNEAASRTPAVVPASTVGMTLDEVRRRSKPGERSAKRDPPREIRQERSAKRGP